jgi:hypothetical protein
VQSDNYSDLAFHDTVLKNIPIQQHLKIHNTKPAVMPHKKKSLGYNTIETIKHLIASIRYTVLGSSELHVVQLVIELHFAVAWW